MRNLRELWNDGMLRVEIMGEITRTFYWQWQCVDGIWRRVPTDWVLLRPLNNWPISPEMMPGVEIVQLGHGLH